MGMDGKYFRHATHRPEPAEILPAIQFRVGPMAALVVFAILEIATTLLPSCRPTANGTVASFSGRGFSQQPIAGDPPPPSLLCLSSNGLRLLCVL